MKFNPSLYYGPQYDIYIKNGQKKPYERFDQMKTSSSCSRDGYTYLFIRFEMKFARNNEKSRHLFCLNKSFLMGS